jgi:hypothetical protein
MLAGLFSSPAINASERMPGFRFARPSAAQQQLVVLARRPVVRSGAWNNVDRSGLSLVA